MMGMLGVNNGDLHADSIAGARERSRTRACSGATFRVPSSSLSRRNYSYRSSVEALRQQSGEAGLPLHHTQ